MKKSQRFAVMIDSFTLARWKVESIKHLTEMKQLELCLVILVDKQDQAIHPKTFFQIYSTIINKFVKSLECINNGSLLKHLPVCSYQGSSTEAAELLQKTELDFILNLSESKASGFILNSVRHGVWRFTFHDFPRISKGPAFFWELYNHDPVICASLIQETDDSSTPKTLKKGCFATAADSLAAAKELVYSSVVKWPAYVCVELTSGNAETVQAPLQREPAEALAEPDARQTLTLIGRLLKRKTISLFNKLFRYEYWNIGIIDQPINEVISDAAPKIQWIVHDGNVYYADPFGYQRDGRTQILMEELDYKVVKGYISQVNLYLSNVNKKDAAVTSSVIRLPTHMSYPYVVEHENEIYCVPETSEEREVALYRLDAEGEKWLKEKTLLNNFPGVDSSLIQYEGRWWLFCTKAFESAQSQNNDLHIYYSDDLLGEWLPHSCNPVKIDSRSSRPAGTPFIFKEKLYRPAQDCSRTYGGRVVVNQIEKLTPTSFIETPASFIHPRPDSAYPDGLHTIAKIGDVTIVDGKRFDYHFSHLYKKLYKFLPVKSQNPLPQRAE
ncbi:hypothetical protein [Alteribacillus sp. HJP-4]|uniref:glucosamine inositolphosphorylceramide transferase family protein n=1 Tax=Alteribacillus sp. HJP-4 TaxID=2775394 RepID=UPI0035CD055B